jgi:H+/gluconate symporter-like permease
MIMFENLEPSDCGLASTIGLITYQILNQFSANLSLTAIYSITITVICYSLILSHFKNSQLAKKAFNIDYKQEVEEMQQQGQNQSQGQTGKVKTSSPKRFVVSFSLLKLTEKDVLLCAIVGLGIGCLIEVTGNIKATVFGIAVYPWFGFLAVPFTAMVISFQHKLNSNTQSLSTNQDKA